MRMLKGGMREWGWAQAVILSASVMLAVLAFPVAADGQEDDHATRTKAARGLAWGAAAGGVLGGLAFGVLSSGLCDAADCSGSFFEGFLPGLLVGGAGGGLTGLVIGSALPEEGRAVGDWSVAARIGAGGARNADVSGFGPAAEIYALRSITRRIRFGVTLEYLGDSERQSSFTIVGRDGVPAQRTERRRLWIGGLRLVAARSLGSDPARGLYVVGRVGLHPTAEHLDFADDGGPFGSSIRSFVLAPGGGLGAGVLLAVGQRWALDVEARGDVVVGIGSSGVVPAAYLTLGLRRGR